MTTAVSTAHLREMMQDARVRTLALVADLDAAQLMGPKLATVNPLRWEVGHVAYFYEYFVLRGLYGRAGVIGARSDTLYDSIDIAHADRWDLPLLSMSDTLQYMADTKDALIDCLERQGADDDQRFMLQFGIFHEDMHTEAFLWGRQTLAYPEPVFDETRLPAGGTGGDLGYADIPGGRFRMGAPADAPFSFDNERQGHVVEVAPFAISKTAVRNGEFADFVADGGYRDDRLWHPDGIAWRNARGLAHPGYWQPDGAGGWTVRRFDLIEPLKPNHPVCHISWYEADAFARWAGARLPTETEWEVAALGMPAPGGTLAEGKRRYPWGDIADDGRRANLDGYTIGTTDVTAHPAGDSAFGCRQMLGNVWEWCSDTFGPYPGFKPDAYQDYSQVLFGSTKVMRGGAWTTRSRMMHGTYRNYFEAHRWDVFAGLRLCRK